MFPLPLRYRRTPGYVRARLHIHKQQLNDNWQEHHDCNNLSKAPAIVVIGGGY